MKIIKIELSLEELNIILSGLGELPAKDSYHTITKLREEAAKQLPESK